jgi:hypothetical protein
MKQIVFPTRVGVNRDGTAFLGEWTRIPHTRGGEPQECSG